MNSVAPRRLSSTVLSLAADAKWRYIDILPDKSQLTSEAQGELPSQTQLNKLVAVHPGVGADASAAAAYINNTDNVFVIEDMKGNFRVLGNDKWSTKATVAQDSDRVPPAPPQPLSTSRLPTRCLRRSMSALETEDGDIECKKAA